MRVKDCYSLQIDELINEMPTTENLPSNFDGGISVATVYENYEDSLNIFKAFANYIVERNRTRDIAQQFAAAEMTLNAFLLRCRVLLIRLNNLPKNLCQGTNITTKSKKKELEIIIEGPPAGKFKTYRINPYIAHKGADRDNTIADFNSALKNRNAD